MIRLLSTIMSLILAITVSATEAMLNDKSNVILPINEDQEGYFKTYSTIFQDYCQPSKLNKYYLFNIYCGYQPGKAVFTRKGEPLDTYYYMYDKSGNMLEYKNQIHTSNTIFQENKYQYDQDNRLVYQEEFYPNSNYTLKEEYEYNDDGYVSGQTSTIDYDGDINTETLTYMYDSILHNYLIKTTHNYSSSGTNNITYNNYIIDEETRIHRNSEGNITKYEYFTHYSSGLDNWNNSDTIPNWYVVIEYNENNIAHNIKRYYMDHYSPIPILSIEYSDIEWYCTNGQILFDLMPIYLTNGHNGYARGLNLTELAYTNYGDFWTKLDCNNLIKEVTIINHEEKNTVNSFRLKFSYPELFGSYQCEIYYDDQLLTSNKFILRDEGLVIEREQRYYMTYDNSTSTFNTSEYVEYLESHTDKYGLSGKAISKEGHPNDLYESSTETKLILYPDTFLPYKLAYSDGDEYIYSEYQIDNNSLESTVQDNLPSRYYTLQGIAVKEDNLIPGIYIKVNSSGMRKILLK